MFQFTSKAKTWAYVLIVVGLVATVMGFMNNPALSAGHGEDHHTTEVHTDHHEGAEHAATEAHGDHGDAHAEAAHAEAGHDASHDAHAEHALHQQQNRPWAGFMVNTFFFLAIGLGALFFLGIQYVAQVGWSAGLTRVFEAVGLFVIIPLIGMTFIVVAGGMHWHHLWHWMQEGIMVEGSENYDEIIAGKEGYLNFGFFLIRTLAYFAIWTWAAITIRKNSKKEDIEGGYSYFWKNRKVAAIFTVLFAVTSSTSAWDWIMSLDPHWFSTLFGWYTFAGIFVTSLAALNILVAYLKSKGYMEWINDNHIHDLAKFMFAFSVFWTYLWFSQFMLIWYSNIPEEVTYYMQRWGQYKTLFFSMVALNFLFPVLLVMSRDAKRVSTIAVFTAVFVLIGHWLDHYIMIMPGTVGEYYGFGLPEIGGFLLYLGLYILVVFRNLASAPLRQKNHPMAVEADHFHQ